MKRFIVFIMLTLLLFGCAPAPDYAQIAATTLPVYDFTAALCQDTPITVSRLITEEVSCLHDYSLNVSQVKAAQAAEVTVISGAGLEEFMTDILSGSHTIDASANIPLICPDEEEPEHSHSHDHEHSHSHGHEHSHESDPHIWLSPANARIMVQNICDGLCIYYPQYGQTFRRNLARLNDQLKELEEYGTQALSQLSGRQIITFHDGFSYFAQAFDLTILEAVEEESGSEASAKELIHLIEEVEHHALPAIFTEKSGSVSAAQIIARETGCGLYTLDMAMASGSYFDAMYHNINTVKEALQ